MGFRAGDWGRAGDRWFRFEGDRPSEVPASEVPAEARAELDEAAAHAEALQACAETGVPGAGEAMARVCDGALSDPATTPEARERVLQGIREVRS